MTARVEPVPNEARVFQGRRAGLVTRVVAACVDVGVVAIALVLAYLGVVVVVFLVQRHEFEMPVPPLWLGPVAGAVAMTLYLAIWWHMGGRTYGNHVMGLRVLDRRGRKPGIVTAFLRAAMWSIPSGYIAVTAGWTTTEVGRQPWVVYGHLRTAEAVTPSLTGADVLASLLAYIVVYAVIFGAGLYYLVRLVQRGLPEELPEFHSGQRPARPLSAAGQED